MGIDLAVDTINKLRADGKLTEEEYSKAVATLVNSSLCGDIDMGYYDN